MYTILHDDFYNAFYEYNAAREEEGLEPLWLIHGVWVNDYVQNSHRDAYDDDFLQALMDDSKTLVDILHGERSLSLGRGLGSGSYRKDVSPWVIGYILGVEWEDVTVAYTDETSTRSGTSYSWHLHGDHRGGHPLRGHAGPGGRQHHRV